MAGNSESFTLQELIESLIHELCEAHQNSFLLQFQHWNYVLGKGIDEVTVDDAILEGLADARLLTIDEVILRIKVSPLPSKISFAKRLKIVTQLLLGRKVDAFSPKVFYFQENEESPLELEIKLVRDREGRFELNDKTLAPILEKYKISNEYNAG